MTNLEKRGFEALTTKSTWSSFDDITWDDFNGDDHSVPEPEEPSQPFWLHGRRRELKSIKDSETPAPEDSSSMDVDWEVAELGAVPENLISETELIVNELKQESPTLLPGGLCLDGQVFNEEDDSSAAHFTYVPPEEEMELFGNESDVDKAGTLLGYGWDNLEDMDNLFQSEETSAFCQDAADALIQWPPSSSSSPDSGAVVNPTTIPKSSPELRAMKGKAHEDDMKMEFIPCERLRTSSEVEVCANNSEVEVDGVMDDYGEVDAGAQSDYSKCSSDAAVEDPLRPLTSPRNKDQKPVDLVDKAKHRQASSHRKDRLKKQQAFQKKPGQAPIQPKQQPLTHYSSAQLKPAVASSLQVYPQVMGPAVAPGMIAVPPQQQFIGPPYLLQGSPQPMVCYEHPEAQRQQLEALAPPPVSGSNMTPQEKIEKLRWKQKMHRLASEQQQEQFVKHCMSSDPGSKMKPGKNQGKRPLLEPETNPMTTDEADGRFVEATVLSQLLSIMSKLDVGTRICIRDALYRLAKSATNRHTTDGASSSECSNSSATGDQASRAFRYPMLETETNPIDRSIANLLFHKRNTTGTLLAGPQPWPEWTISWQQQGGSEDGVAPEGCFTPPGAAAGDQSTDLSSDDRESEGSSRRIEKLKVCDAATPRSGLKREASNEFLSSQEDRGRGTCISRSDSPRGGKASKTGIQ